MVRSVLASLVTAVLLTACPEDTGEGEGEGAEGEGEGEGEGESAGEGEGEGESAGEGEGEGDDGTLHLCCVNGAEGAQAYDCGSADLAACEASGTVSNCFRNGGRDVECD